MAELAGLSLACNVMQVISFAHETFNLCKEIYTKGEENPSLEANANAMSVLTDALDERLSSSEEARPKTEAAQQLEATSRRCLASAKALTKQLREIGASKAKGHVRRTVKVAFKTWWKSDELERLRIEMREYQQTLNFGLLLRICSSNEATAIQNQGDFTKLDTQLQTVVSAVASGRSELLDSIGQVRQFLMKESALRYDETVRKKFLDSIMFDTMNARKTAINEKHPKTFDWIFLDQMPKQRNWEDWSSDYDESDWSSDDDESKWISDEDESDSDSKPDKEGPRLERRNPNAVVKRPRFAPRTIQRQNSPEGGTMSKASDRDNNHDAVTIQPDTVKQWDNFACWLRSANKIYWISGKAGSGKSTLMRFLIDAKATSTNLTASGHETRIISHFLISGSDSLKIQRSIKGTLCSLLYQVLEEDRDTIAAVLEQFQHRKLTSKTSHNDWSRSELEEVLCFSLEAMKPNVCIFVDGLDEILPSDGIDNLWSVLRKLTELNSVKLCVSSRLEPEIEVHLRNYPHLRLEILTRRDITRYASHRLHPKSFPEHGTYDHPTYRTLVQEICRKAEGVFLWVVIVVKSLRQGLFHKNSISDLKARLDAFPSELPELFQNMWARLGPSKSIYLRTAAAYFNFALLASDLAEGGYYLTVYDLMVASDEKIQRTLETGDFPSPQDISKKCEDVINKIKTRCAGLLEYSQIYLGDEWLNSSSPYKEQFKFVRLKIRFIHRSAQDWLTHEAEGIQIRAYDDSTPDKRLHSLLLARVLNTCIWKLHPRSDLTFRSYLDSILDCRHYFSEGHRNDIILAFWLVYNHTYNGKQTVFLAEKCDIPSGPNPKPDFIAFIAESPLLYLVPGYLKSLQLHPNESLISGSLHRYLIRPRHSSSIHYLNYLALCSVSTRHYTVRSFRYALPALIDWLTMLKNIGADFKFRGSSTFEIPSAVWARVESSAEHQPIYLQPQSTVSRLVQWVYRGDSLITIYILNFLASLTNEELMLDEPVLLVLPHPEEHKRFIIEDLNCLHSGFRGLVFKTNIGYLLRLALYRLRHPRRRSTMNFPVAQNLSDNLLKRIPSEEQYSNPTVLAVPPPKARQDSAGTRMYIPPQGPHSVRIVGVLNGILNGMVEGNLFYSTRDKRDQLWKHIDSIIKECKPTRMRKVEDKLFKAGYLVLAEAYLKEIPHLSKEDEAIVSQRIAADIDEAKRRAWPS